MVRQRRAWSAMVSSASCSCPGRVPSARRSSARCSTAESGLLSSWATPEATRPMALSRSCWSAWACATWSCSYAARRLASSVRTRTAMRSKAYASAATSSPRESPTGGTSRSPRAICAAAARSRPIGRAMLRANAAARISPITSAASATVAEVRPSCDQLRGIVLDRGDRDEHRAVAVRQHARAVLEGDHLVLPVAAGEPALVPPLDRAEVAAAVTVQHRPGPPAPDDEVVRAPHHEPVGVGPQRRQRGLESRVARGAPDRVGQRVGPQLLPVELRLGQRVEHDRHGHADRERDRDGEHLAVERFHDLVPGRHREVLDRALGHQVRRHGEEQAEGGALDHDLHDLEVREGGEVIHLQGARACSRRCWCRAPSRRRRGEIGRAAGRRRCRPRQPAGQPPEPQPRNQDRAGPPDGRHFPGVAEADPGRAGSR